MEFEKLPREIESGNLEYKLKVIPDNELRIDKLASQMKWRLQEGNGIAYYYLGICDDGNINGICKRDYNISIKNLSKVSKIINSKIKNIENKKSNDKEWFIIRIEFNEVCAFNSRILFIGPSTSGKTTLISNLVNNISDDGNGKSRNLVFNHKHEIYSGITSSISIEKKIIKNEGDTICVNFIDTPGYSKFLKTTISGICKYDCNLIILCINPIDVKLDDLFFYFRLLKFLDKEFIIVLTKKDLYKTYHKTYILKNMLEFIDKEYKKENLKYVPIIEVSNITKSGYRKLLHKINNSKYKKSIPNDILKFQICDIMKIPNIGKIYTGILFSGTFEKNKNYVLSNSDTSNDIIVKSIHFNDKSYEKINGNQLVTIELESDIDFSNKSDKIITENNVNISRTLLVKCSSEINYNTGICIYNNQQCLVKIKKIEDKYELSRVDGFINLCDKIILKVNDKYYFTDLIK